MPQMRDASALVTGQVLDVTNVTKRGIPSDQPQVLEAIKITVLSADAGGAGLAVVKVKVDADGRLPIPVPPLTSTIAFVVRSAPYDITDGGQRNAGMSTGFVRLATGADLDDYHGAIQAQADWIKAATAPVQAAK